MIIMRLIAQTIVSAAGQIWANKVRAFLTCLGIIIGVWAITSVIAAVGALNNYVLKEFEAFGANKLMINGMVPQKQRGMMDWDSVKISAFEARMLRERCSTIDKLAVTTQFRGRIRSAQRELTGVRVSAVQPQWYDIERRVILDGRTLNQADEEGGFQVAMVDEKAVEELLLDGGGVGQKITIDNREFLIVGVLQTQTRSPMFGGGEAQSEIVIPYATMDKIRDWTRRWPTVFALMKDKTDIEEARSEVRFVLRKMRQLPPEQEDTFEIIIFEQFLQVMKNLANGMAMGASVLVGISLLVGGVGIMNVMLVSVSERTREIGLRKAVGAGPLVVLLQFLTEAVTLCLFGGLIGLILGQATTLAMPHIPGSVLKDAEIPVSAIALAFWFSAGVGVVFGMWPAMKAARLNPIEALRHE